MHMNKVFLIGNVVRDPELRHPATSNSSVTDIRLAVNRVWRNPKGEKKEETLFIDVTTWAKSAENAAAYLKKGRLIAVEGRLQLQEWTGADGKRQSRIKVSADRISYLPSGRRDGDVPAPAQEGSEEEESFEERQAVA